MPGNAYCVAPMARSRWLRDHYATLMIEIEQNATRCCDHTPPSLGSVVCRTAVVWTDGAVRRTNTFWKWVRVRHRARRFFGWMRDRLTMRRTTYNQLAQWMERGVRFLKDWCGLMIVFVSLYVIVRRLCVLTGFVQGSTC